MIQNQYMWFPAAIIASTLITITSIFTVYKLFLDKPPTISSNANQSIIASPSISGSPPITQDKPSPSSSTASTTTSKPSPKAKSAIIGTLEVLKNNLSSPSPSVADLANSTISGSIGLSGTIPSSASIVIVMRENGSGNTYKTVVSGISASNGTGWNWSGAKSGVSYDMIAILKGQSGGNNVDYAASQTYTVPAPASSQTFSINAGTIPSTPTGTITTTCTTHNSNNTWYATVNYPTVSGGQSYKLQAGTTSAGNDLANTTQNAQSTTNQTISVTITDSKLYYAQYSVSDVPNPTSYQYSAFSTPQTIKCP